MKYTVYPVHTMLRESQDIPSVAVVIDTLRMTSVAATALQNGCERLRAVGTVEEARELAAAFDALLGGERGALKIPGFDLSNTPQEYRPEAVAGRKLVMTTSNGTQAIESACRAEKLYLGCLRNAGAVAECLRGEAEVALVLAGTGGRFSLEDALTAGAIMDRLGPGEMDDMAMAAWTLYRQNRGDLHSLLSQCRHYQKLVRLGLEEDVAFCLQEDVCGSVPMRCADNWFVDVRRELK